MPSPAPAARTDPRAKPHGVGSRTAPAARADERVCRHCAQPLGRSDVEGFCCPGCRVVHDLLGREGLARYYDLRRGPGVPVAATPDARRDLKWIDALPPRTAAVERIDLAIQGVHCAACVWLVERLFARRPGHVRALLNPALGRLTLHATPELDLRAFVADVERFGYLLGPAGAEPARGDGGLLVRMGITAALALNAMMLSAAVYFGLEEGALAALVHQLLFALASVSMLVGGSVFVRSAWRAARRGVMHFDVPIALGMLLAFAGVSLVYFVEGRGAAYADTLTVFIALMVAGRWLQEHILEQNRRRILASHGADALLTRRLEGGQVRVVPTGQIAPGHILLVAPGDLVPVPARVLDDAVPCSLDWIKGESRPRHFGVGDVVPAGAFNAGDSALRLEAASDLAGGGLPALLSTTRDRPRAGAGEGRFWEGVARFYTLFVLAAAAGAALFWWLTTRDASRVVEVTVAVLVVTCPCAFGIGTPLAHELAHAGLRRAGLFVRTSGLLDRLRQVRRIVFDKTGTLTTGTLEVETDAPLRALGDAHVLYNLAARSGHPKSRAVVRALERARPEAQIDASLSPREVTGCGMELELEGELHRFGDPAWALSDEDAPAGADLAYSVDGRPRALLATREEMRHDAVRELDGLRRAGLGLWILSGDAGCRVRAMAERLGVEPERAMGECSPEDKATWLRASSPEETLFIGDGINDGPAAGTALCAGTPAVDRPFMPARTDFYFVTPGLRPLALALRTAAALHRAVRRNLAFAVVYNLTTVGLAFAGLMQPWLAAVLMPLSSAVVLTATASSLGPRSSLWTS